MLDRIKPHTPEVYMGNVRETQAKYIGLITGELAVARLRLREVLDRDEPTAIAIFTDKVEALERQLKLARASAQLVEATT